MFSCYFICLDIPQFCNMDLESVVTPIRTNQLDKLLRDSQYDKEKSKFLLDRFVNGFRLQYDGPQERRDRSRNILFNVGSPKELWSKIMKEVSLNRYAGPFKHIPFEHFVQSLIGLVLKDGGLQTRLIFHLSYDFLVNKSVNSFTPKEKYTVKYKDLDHAVKESLGLLKEILTEDGNVSIWYGKSDLKSAFRVLGLNPKDFWLLVMCAIHPVTGMEYFFVEKCLPFGHSISCALFQEFSDALAHMTRYLIKVKTRNQNPALTNYLNDFLFASLLRKMTDTMLDIFLKMCEQLGVPVSLEKTEFACNVIVFLGILMDGYSLVLAVPEQKRLVALQLLNRMTDKKSATVKEIQSQAGLLNFLHRAIVPGRAFTRRMYAKFSHILDKNGNRIPGTRIKQYHHIHLDTEFKADCRMWADFLLMQETGKKVLCRPFIDMEVTLHAETLQFFTDAAKGEKLGIGGVFGRAWYIAKWEPGFIKRCDPSIEYLELLAVCMGVFCWAENLKNKRFVMFCDNQSIVTMINDTTSSCKNCMYLIRRLVLKCLEFNMRIFCHWIQVDSEFQGRFLISSEN